MIPPLFRTAIRLQVAYGAGVLLWQLAGLALLASGRPALGPTASGGVAFFAIASTSALVWLARSRPGLYLTLATAIAIPALLALQNAIVGDPSLWPSPWARWGGAALNALGILAPALAFAGWRAMRSGAER